MNNTSDCTTGDVTQQQQKAAAKWLSARLDRGRRERFAEFGVLTPALASALLGLNAENRTIRETTYQRYAKDIAAGRWELNGEAIVISACGNLNDGQHRCKAVLMCGIPIDALFTFGVSFESRLTTDQGQAKTAGDYLGMDGVKNCNNIASIAKAVLEFEAFQKFTSTAALKPTKAEVRERALIDDSIQASFDAVHQKGGNRLASYTVLGLAHYLFSRRDEYRACEFMDKLIAGTELKRGDPIHVAREKLLDPYKRLTKNEQLKCLIMAWNNWRSGKSVRSLTHSLKKGEKMPEIK